MSIILDGTNGITTPDVTSDGSLKIDASAPDDSVVVDANGNLALGATSANEKVLIASSSAASYIQICDSSTGTSSGDGLFLGSFNGAAELKTKENTSLAFGTNNTERVRIDSNGIVTRNKGSIDRFIVGLNVGGNTTTWYNIYPFINTYCKYYLSTHENGFEQFWEVSVGYQGVVAAIKTPDTGHVHSGDFTFRLSGGYLQCKNVSYTTGRSLYLYHIESA